MSLFNSIQRILFLCIALILLVIGGCLSESPTSTNSNSNGNANTGTGGSLARFTTVDSVLYSVDNTTLRIFNLSAGNARLVKEIEVGFNIETIFARGNVLFMGSNSGVYIYSIEKREQPVKISLYQHITSCDPVVADDKFAYATLRTEQTRCSRGINALEVINITNLRNPFLVYSINLSQPKGLGLSGNRLVLCNKGLELYNVQDRIIPILIKKNLQFNPSDVIIQGTTGIALIDNGMFNFDFTNDTLKIIGQLTY